MRPCVGGWAGGYGWVDCGDGWKGLTIEGTVEERVYVCVFWAGWGGGRGQEDEGPYITAM